MDLSFTSLPPARTRRLIIIGGLAIGIAIFAIAVIIYRDTPRTTALPVAIQLVEPTPQSNVLSQSDVLVDLAVGYTASLDINGVPIPDSEVTETSALNTLRFQPGQGKVIEALFPDQNCVRVTYWLIVEGPSNSQTYTWCFFAS